MDPAMAEVKRRLEALGADPAFRGNPLMGELVRMGEEQLRLLRRMNKISRISDGFQAQLKEVNDFLQKASLTDPLTDLPNRRAMMKHLHAEQLRAVREGIPLTVIMADVDRFKAVNDTHGHEAGDRVLSALSAAMKESLRAYDVCCRWGGEEFLALLPGTDSRGGQEVGEKLRKAVAALSVVSGASRIRVTLSVGVALLEEGESLDALLRRADRTMYEAKRRGGDRVVG